PGGGEVDASCVKILNMFKRNIEKGLPSINAQVLVINTDTGVIEGIVDGSYVTQLRTGAASGAALPQARAATDRTKSWSCFRSGNTP
ncbi:hypothetical protein LJC36_02400, partial [Desulfovibrio sp. OttesenSCG-928-C14]|nr:hypothetical protein [Desulfovibrio sp. OttesenSCG-928-C14]